MARPSDTIQLTDKELQYVEQVLAVEGEWFANPVGWPEHCPDTINLLMMYWFGTRLTPHQLGFYYCPVPEGTVIGGRGSAKTTGLALVAAMFTALHPGESWMHTAPSLDQARKAKQVIQEFGTRSVPARRTFFETFVAAAPDSPLPTIKFKSWDLNFDPGNELYFRSATDDVERLRSYEVSVVSADEAFRSIPSGSVWAYLRGCARGINQVKLRTLPPHLREHVQDLLYQWSFASQEEKETIDAYVEELGLNKRNFMLLIGNAGEHDWAWERLEKGWEDPKNYWSLVLTTYDNPYLTRRDRENYERTYDDPEMRNVEMLARRPMGMGNVFTLDHLRRGLRRELRDEILEHVRAQEDGWLWHVVPPHGQVKVMVPPTPEHVYCLGADPGLGVVPKRNSWSVFCFDITSPPARLVYYEWGNVGKSSGSYDPFLASVRNAMARYMIMDQMACVDSTGPSKGMVELAFGEDVRVNPISFNTMKPAMINWGRNLMGKDMIKMPMIDPLWRQLSNYVEKDDKIPQDLVAGLLLACIPIQMVFGGLANPGDGKPVSYRQSAADVVLSRVKRYADRARRTGGER